MIPQALIDADFSHRLCMVLLHSLWQVSALAALAWAGDLLWRKRRVERSYGFHVAALLAALAAMPITYSLLETTNTPTESVALSSPLVETLAPVVEVVPSPLPAPSIAPENFIPALLPPIAVAPPAQMVVETASLWQRLVPWVVGMYSLGVLAMLARLASAIIKTNRLSPNAKKLTDGPLVDLLQSLAKRWSMNVAPAIATTADIVVPKVVGLTRPMILLPTSAITGLSSAELEMILAHELAHVRRHDMWVNLVQRLAESVLFFNPALWYLSRRISTLREYCCDEMTCQAMSENTEESQMQYASALLRVAELAQPASKAHHQLAALTATGRSPSELRRRVARLFGEPLKEPLRLSRGGIAAAALFVLMFAVGPFVQSPATKPDDDAGNKTDDTAISIMKFPSGGKVRLLGIAAYGKKPQRWWLSNGELLRGQPSSYMKGGTIQTGKRMVAREVGFQIEGLADEIGIKYSVYATGDANKNDLISLGLSVDKDRRWSAFEIDKRAKSFNLRVGVAAGKWKTVGHAGATGGSGSSRDNSGSKIMFSEVLSKKGKAVTIISHTLKTKHIELRAAAISKQGKVYYASSGNWHSIGDRQNLNQWTFEFDGVKREDVRRVELQTRRYEWVELKGLPLNPINDGDAEKNLGTGLKSDAGITEGLVLQDSSPLPNGIYRIRPEDSTEHGTNVRVNNVKNKEVVLLDRLATKFGKVRIRSVANDNSKFGISLKSAGPFAEVDDLSNVAIMADGVCVVLAWDGDLKKEGYQHLEALVYGEGNAHRMAKSLGTSALLRKHPGHQIETKFTPTKPSFQPGEPVTLKLKITNTGDQPFSFYDDGRQRGSRNDQFGFTAFRNAGKGKEVPDTGDSINFGGRAASRTLQPGESFEKEVDILKWFDLSQPDTYKINGRFEFEMFNPEERLYRIKWEDTGKDDCMVVIGEGDEHEDTVAADTQATNSSNAEFGPESHGLRCRLVAVVPKSDDESPDLTKRTGKFSSGSKLTFAVELKNVSDQPVTLLGVRLGEGYGASKGKLNTARNAPYLFEFDFTDANGKPVPRTERTFIRDGLVLSGASTHKIAPGESLKVLLRPAKFLAPMQHELPPGDFQATVRYRGPNEEARSQIKKHWPNKPLANAWHHEVTSNAVKFSIAKDPAAPKPPQLVWGLIKDGLQAAIEFPVPEYVQGIPTEAPGVPVGTNLGVVFHVKNVSNKPITFVSETHRQGDRFHITNVKIQARFSTGVPIYVRWNLKPGEVAKLRVLTPGINSIEQPGLYIVAYTISFNNRQSKDGEGNIVFPLPGDWQQELETGAAPLFLRDPYAKDEAKLGKSATLRQMVEKLIEDKESKFVRVEESMAKPSHGWLRVPEGANRVLRANIIGRYNHNHKLLFEYFSGLSKDQDWLDMYTRTVASAEPFGPKITLQKLFGEHLGYKLTFFNWPNNANGESGDKYVAAWSVYNPEELKQALARFKHMNYPTKATPIEYAGVTIWQATKKDSLIPCACVANNHLFIASDLQSMEKILVKFKRVSYQGKGGVVRQPSIKWFHSGDHVHFVLFHPGYMQSGLSAQTRFSTLHTPCLWNVQGFVNLLGSAPLKGGEERKKRQVPLKFDYFPHRDKQFELSIDSCEYDLANGRVFVLNMLGEPQQLAIDLPKTAWKEKDVDVLAVAIKEAQAKAKPRLQIREMLRFFNSDDVDTKLKAANLDVEMNIASWMPPSGKSEFLTWAADSPAFIVETDVASAIAKPVRNGNGSKYGIYLKLTPEAGKRLARQTKRIRDKHGPGRPIAIMVDGKVVMEPKLNSVIRGDGDLEISGNFSKQEAEAIAAKIKPVTDRGSKDQRTIPKNILWGKLVDGLRLGIKPTVLKNVGPENELGDYLSYSIWIKNETDRQVVIPGDPSTMFTPRLVKDGELNLVGSIVGNSWDVPEAERLKATIFLMPGEAKSFGIQPLFPLSPKRLPNGLSSSLISEGKFQVYAERDVPIRGVDSNGDGSGKSVHLRSGTFHLDNQFTVQRPGEQFKPLSLQIVDHHNKPVPDTSVYLLHPNASTDKKRIETITHNNGTYTFPYVRSAKTDAEGRCNMVHDRGTSNRIAVTGSDHKLVILPPVANRGDEPLVIKLPAPATVLVKSTQFGSQQNEYIHIRAMAEKMGHWADIRAEFRAFPSAPSAETHETEYEFRGLAPGRYEISRMKRIQFPDFGRSVRVGLQRITVGSGKNETVKFAPMRGPVLSGRVEGMEAHGLYDAMITFMKIDDQLKDKQQKYIEADEVVQCLQGKDFKTVPLSPGKYRWNLVGVRQKPQRKVLILLPRFGDYFLQGEVTVGGADGAESLVIKIPEPSEQELAQYKNQQVTNAKLKPRTNKLIIKAVDKDGKPVTSVYITLWKAMPKGLRPEGESPRWTDSTTNVTWLRQGMAHPNDGRHPKEGVETYSFENLRPGRYMVTAATYRPKESTPDATPFGSSEVITLDSKSPAELTITLAKGDATLELIFVDSKTKQPIDALPIHLRNAKRMPIVHGYGSGFLFERTDSAGKMAYRHLPTGKYFVEVLSKWPVINEFIEYERLPYNQLTIDVHPGKQTIPLELVSHKLDQKMIDKRFPFHVFGRVTDTQGKPIEGVEVRVATGVNTLMGSAQVKTDVTGRYRLYFPPGLLFYNAPPHGVGVQAAIFFVAKPSWKLVGKPEEYHWLMTDQTRKRIAEQIEQGSSPWGQKDIEKFVFANKPREINFVMSKAPESSNQPESPLSKKDRANIGNLFDDLEIDYLKKKPKVKTAKPKAEAVKKFPREFKVSIVGPDGKPVPYVKVRHIAAFVSKDPRFRFNGANSFPTADDKGQLVFMVNAQPKQFTLYIQHPGFGPYWASWDSSDHPEPIPLEFTAKLEGGWSVGGVVVDNESNPIRNARVHPSIEYKKRPGDKRQMAVGRNIKTDSKGRWRFDSIPNSMNLVYVTITHPKFGTLSQRLSRDTFAVKPGTPPTAQIIFKPGLTITGKVTDEAGQPVVGAVVRTKFVNNICKAKTNEQGVYKIVGCEIRMARVVVSAKGKALDMQEVRVYQDMLPVNFVMKPGGKIRIRVVDEQGDGVAKSRIFFQRWRGDIDYFEFDHVNQHTNADGVWEWDEAPLDEFKADICRKNGMTLVEQSLIARDEEYVFNPPRRLLDISGQVVNAVTNEPVKKFRVVSGVRDQARQQSGVSWSLRYSATEGKYRITRNRTAPAHMVRIEAEGFQVATSREFKSDEGRVTYDFKLQPVKKVVTTIVTAKGEPAIGAKVVLGVAGTQILVRNGDIRDSSTYATRLDVDERGQFAMPARSEPFQIVIMHPAGFAHLSFNKKGEPETPLPSQITLTAWARLEGTFRVGAKPAPNVKLWLNSEAIHSWGNKVPNISTSNYATTGNDGRYIFERVFPGKGRVGRNIVVMVNDGASEVTSSQRIAAEFVAGKTTTLNLGGTGQPVTGKLVPPASYQGRVNWNFAMITVQADIPHPKYPTPPAEIQNDAKETAAWWKAWSETKAGKALLVAIEKYNALQDAAPYITASVDRDGSFHIDDAPSGKFVLSVRFQKTAPGVLRDHKFTVPVVEGGRSDEPFDLGNLKLQPVMPAPIPATPKREAEDSAASIEKQKSKSQLSVNVLAPETGKPVTNAYITLWKAMPKGVQPMGFGPRWNDSRTNVTWLRNGVAYPKQDVESYTFENLSIGRYMVTAATYRPKETTPDPTPFGSSEVITLDGKSPAELTITLAKGDAAVELTFVDSKTKQPINTVPIRLRNARHTPIVHGHFIGNFFERTDAAGKMTYQHLPSGRYFVEVLYRWPVINEFIEYECLDYSRLAIDVRPGKQSFQFELVGHKLDQKKIDKLFPFHVFGRVTDRQGKPIEGVEVRAATGMFSIAGRAQVKTGSSGWYKLYFGPGMLIGGRPLGVGIQAASITARKEGLREANENRHGELLMSDQSVADLQKQLKTSGQIWDKTSVEQIVLPNVPREVNFVMSKAL